MGPQPFNPDYQAIIVKADDQQGRTDYWLVVILFLSHLANMPIKNHSLGGIDFFQIFVCDNMLLRQLCYHIIGKLFWEKPVYSYLRK